MTPSRREERQERREHRHDPEPNDDLNADEQGEPDDDVREALAQPEEE